MQAKSATVTRILYACAQGLSAMYKHPSLQASALQALGLNTACSHQALLQNSLPLEHFRDADWSCLWLPGARWMCACFQGLITGDNSCALGLLDLERKDVKTSTAGIPSKGCVMLPF